MSKFTGIAKKVSRAFPAPALLPPLNLNNDLIRDPDLRPVAAKLMAGKRLDMADGLALMNSRDLTGLGHMADAARRAKNGDKAYYVRNRHFNYSNICSNRCTFCAFWRESDGPGAYLYSPREAAEKVSENPGMALDELHVVGSCHPGTDFSYYPELLRALSEARPGATLKAFTPVEIEHMALSSGLEVGEVLDILISAGLAAMPGGGAEVFSQRVRYELCPLKPSAERWLDVTRQAHERGVQTNATMLYGHIETPLERVEHLLTLRRQQDETGGFSAFIPLSFHPENTGLAHLPPTTALDDLRVTAASRLLLDNFPHIKAYWVMMGPGLAQLALSYGADDMDGTIVEEHIFQEAGGKNSSGLTETRLRELITAGGWTPVRRDSFYNSLEQN